MQCNLTRLADRAPAPAVCARVGLGLTILLAGVHKLVAPAAWTVYVADWLAPWLLVSPIVFMLANGVIEVGFGAAILVNRFTWLAAGIAAVSLAATVGYLAIVAAVDGGRFLDVLVRDVGLAALAWSVTVEALQT